MKTQSELYDLSQRTLDIIDDNNLKPSILNASRMTNTILVMAKEADNSHDLQFIRAALDVVQTYASILDDTIDDIDAVVSSIRSNTVFALSEPEAEEDRDED